MIRGAIDAYFERDLDIRMAAAARFLAFPMDPSPEPDWAETKRLLEEDPRLDSIP